MSLKPTLQTAIDTGVLPSVVVLAAKSSSTQETPTHTLALGPRSPTTTSPISPNDIFTLFSLTKLPTTLCLLHLISSTSLGLDDDISAHLPTLAAQPVLTTFLPGGEPVLEPRRQPLTSRQLLTHTSGAGYEFLSPQLTGYLSHIGQLASVQAGRTVEERFNYPLLFQPGCGWAYGSGVSWAGKLVEVLSGVSLEEYMRRYIFAPLGAEPLLFFPDTHLELEARRTALFRRDSRTGALEETRGGNPMFARALGGLSESFGGEGGFGSLASFFEILKSLLRDDEKILPKALTAELFKPQLSGASKAALGEAMADFSWVVGDFEGVKAGEVNWGLGGLVVVGNEHAYRRGGYLTWNGAGNLFWFIDRSADVCGVFGTQVVPGPDPLIEPLIAAFEREVYGVEL